MNDAPLTRSKLSSPPRPMTLDDMMNEITAALRDAIWDTPDASRLEDSPEDVYRDLAARLILKLARQELTIVPAVSPREAREAEIHRATADAAVRTLETLDQWLKAESGRSCETGIGPSEKMEITLLEPMTGGALGEIRGFFQGESVQDAYAQAATAIVCNGGDL